MKKQTMMTDIMLFGCACFLAYILVCEAVPRWADSLPQGQFETYTVR